MGVILAGRAEMNHISAQWLKERYFGDKYQFTVTIANGTPELSPYGIPGRDERKAWCYSARLHGEWMTLDGAYKKGATGVYGRHYCFESEQDAMLFLMTFGGIYTDSKEPTSV